MPHYRRMRLSCAMLIYGALVFVLACAGMARAQGELSGTPHSDWQLRCQARNTNGPAVCAAIQHVTAQEIENIGLSIIFLKHRKDYLLRVLAPLGVLLPPGLRIIAGPALQIDLPFIRCPEAGCIAEYALSQEEARILATGRQASFIVHSAPGEGIMIPVSLAGLGAALAALEP